ncbi:aminotransferase class I/II-fold pyridoxal phosphate-dependent enzyme [Streptomyces sp. OF3]|uniref:Aminotransferase class I/II-fold pyridoxal phosphate-dependent enzyme n=1 Tax=Streptomyces alkaliterrae TaxID=2213162 RepID=A0A7W3WGI3_9ACTN|nr:aminotransferase class I/II-fold pyridoxal phosphate-dependent enzyme [Streptomyces alkaliterrae]MBB1251899.1 aminotransferase class I/II-fold pyridoxal phosphate-dependent enzyme [Streptomyces alkaliterrae]
MRTNGRQEAECLAAACDYWRRRGLETTGDQVALAPGAPVLLLAVLAAAGPRGVLVTRPCAQWYVPQARLLDRPVHPVPISAESGGVPDPIVLLETVRRARAAGGDPRVLLLSVADDPTGTAAPPELLHEVCEVAADHGLLVVSDESWRDTRLAAHETVLVSPAEILHPADDGRPPAAAGDLRGDAVVLLDLRAALLVSGPALACARFPAGESGRALRERVVAALAALAVAPSERALREAARALEEPVALQRELTADNDDHAVRAATLHGLLTELGALCRPATVGRFLYADLEPLRGRLAVSGVTDALSLETALRSGGGGLAHGGHRFGDDPRLLRVRLPTAPPPAHGPDLVTTLRELAGGTAGGSPAEAPGARVGVAPGQTGVDNRAEGNR